MSITINKEASSHDIERCGDCPYQQREQGGVLVCLHRDSPNQGYIISREDLMGFPTKCPIIELGGAITI